MDLFPTLLEAAGLTAPAAKPGAAAAGCDGVSLVPLLRGAGGVTRAELFWHYPHHQHYQLGGATPYGAVRSGDYKLVEFFNDMHAGLYDIKRDVGEERDLAAARPEVVSTPRRRRRTRSDPLEGSRAVRSPPSGDRTLGEVARRGTSCRPFDPRVCTRARGRVQSPPVRL